MTLAPTRPSETQTAPLPENLSSLEPFAGRKRWTRSDCDFLERLGMLPDRFELLDGEIINKLGQNQPHAIAVTPLIKYLTAIFGGDFVLCQLPIEIADVDRPNYQSQPDAAVMTQPVTSYLTEPPGPGDLRLVAEVSDSTLRDDLQIKAPLYARAGIPEYWVLNINSPRLFVHRNPQNGSYTEVHPVTERENERVAAESAPDWQILVADLLPPVAME